nr:hypothetical protein [uncultured Draconibacterium sp.]
MKINNKILGSDLYHRLDKVADSAFSKDFKFKQPLGQEHIEELLPELVEECYSFEIMTLKYSPIDIVNILYKCKLLKSSETEEKYKKQQMFSLNNEFDFYVPWNRKKENLNTLIDYYFERLLSLLKDNTLIIEINSFKGNTNSIQTFFDNLFSSLDKRFKAYISNNSTGTKKTNASIGFKVYGSMCYSRWYANAWLKSFMSILKIGGFLYSSQVNYGWDYAEQPISTYPVFLGTSTSGCFVYNEDTKKPLVKIPDGCLCHSFGNRSITNMWFDIKTFKKVKGFILENKSIFEFHINPWNKTLRTDINQF